jgi:hypothetical protein
MIRNVLFSVLLAFMPLAAQAADTAKEAAPARAFFKNLKDGETVESPVKVVFGVSGMKIAPAGTSEPNTGHFHLLIDTTLTDKHEKIVIRNDTQHLHFGKGQTETTVDLEPGKHTLQLVMGDGQHMLHNPPVMSDVITVTVKARHMEK